MKHIYLTVITLFCFLQSFAQDPELFRTWYLYEFQESDLSTLYIIQNINPPINPFITISETLEFNGEGACNTFDGVFEFQGTNELTATLFNNTTDDCGVQIHNSFESKFFSFMQWDPFWYEIIPDSNGLSLNFYTAIFGFAKFKDYELSVNDELLQVRTSLYPNPTSEILYIKSESPIDAFSIYNVAGQKILERPNLDNSIDVSSLSEGIYFLEISSAEARSKRKFIKK